METLITITTTADDRELLQKIGRRLLEGRLIACIQILGPIQSLYWWKDKLEQTDEWLAVMKSRKSLYGRIEEEIRRLHTYEVPEIVAWEADRVLPSYGEWLLKETEPGFKTTEKPDAGT